jgi:hypothetical protein
LEHRCAGDPRRHGRSAAFIVLPDAKAAEIEASAHGSPRGHVAHDGWCSTDARCAKAPLLEVGNEYLFWRDQGKLARVETSELAHLRRQADICDRSHLFPRYSEAISYS